MLNKVMIMGRLTRDPEMRRTQSGHKTASFSVAVDRDYAPQGSERKTDFIQCVAWNGTAEFIEKYFKKGAMIVVSGRITVDQWTDSDGTRRSRTEISAEQVYFGDSKKTDKPEGEYAPREFEEVDDDDYIPL